MGQNADAISFIRNRLKYTATKCYVGAISAAAINNLWRTINETEFCGFSHNFYCGNISIDSLRRAFVREMSYNPLRFEDVDFSASKKYAPNMAEIVNSVTVVLKRFTEIWPHGINDHISIVDTSDVAYVFLRDLRDCFKQIARQNIADFKQAQYRDEIIARFATATDISMDNTMRDALRQLADASASRRSARRDKTDLASRIASLETQINLHRNHDRQFCMEMMDELEQLKALQERDIVAPRKSVRTRKPRATQTSPVVSAPVAGKVSVSWTEDDEIEYDSDSVERERDLLLSMTPEHTTDEVFQEYVEQMVGLQLSKHQNQR